MYLKSNAFREDTNHGRTTALECGSWRHEPRLEDTNHGLEYGSWRHEPLPNHGFRMWFVKTRTTAEDTNHGRMQQVSGLEA
jgi:hypothetical protein